jgi:hypothetical protein
MLELSPDAVALVVKTRRRWGFPATSGIRIWQDGVGGAGSLRFRFVDRPRTGDEVVGRAGARAFVAPDLANTLADRELDVDGAVDHPRLVLRSAPPTLE